MAKGWHLAAAAAEQCAQALQALYGLAIADRGEAPALWDGEARDAWARGRMREAQEAAATEIRKATIRASELAAFVATMPPEEN